MGFIGNLIGDTIGGLTGAKQSAKGAQLAAQTEASAAERAIAEQRSARTEAAALQDPFVKAGTSSLAQQMSLIGLNGTAGQQDAINALVASPEYSTRIRQGEEGILQNAAATGGLRGGNTQNSLANYRNDTLGSLISQQYERLGGLTSLGQNAAAGVGNAGMSTANNIGGLLQQQGAAIAGGQLAKGNLVSQNLNNMAQVASTVISGVKAF